MLRKRAVKLIRSPLKTKLLVLSAVINGFIAYSKTFTKEQSCSVERWNAFLWSGEGLFIAGGGFDMKLQRRLHFRENKFSYV